MLQVTDEAKVKLKASLEEKPDESDMIVRIVGTPNEPEKLQLAYDKEKENDVVIKDRNDDNILAVDPQLSPMLDGFILDYKEQGFTLAPVSPGDK